MAEIILYSNTGFNSVNLPFNENALYHQDEVPSTYTVDITQVFNLSSISVRVGMESQVVNVDYCIIRGDPKGASGFYCNAYYVVLSYEMTSSDVAKLYLVPDPFMTGGGIENMKATAGVMTRCYEGYDPENTVLTDPMLRCTEPETIKYESAFYINDYGSTDKNDYVIVVASTIDLAKVPGAVNNKLPIYTYNDETGQITYDYVPEPVSGYTEIDIHPSPTLFAREDGSVPTTTGTFTAITQGYALFYYEAVKTRLQVLHAYGYDSAIIGCWRIPRTLITSYTLSTGRISKMEMANMDAANPLGTALDNGAYEGPYYPFVATIANYSPDFKCALMSNASGQSIERRLNETTGRVFAVFDPREDGGPVFIMPDRRMKDSYYNATARAYFAGQIMRNSIKGAQWDSVPLVFTGASGSHRAFQQLALSEEQAQFRYERGLEEAATRGIWNSIMAAAGVGVNAAVSEQNAYQNYMSNYNASYQSYVNSLNQDYSPAQALNGGLYTPYQPQYHAQLTMNPLSLLSVGAAAVGNIVNAALYAQSAGENRQMQSYNEKAAYVLNNTYVAPTLTGRMRESMKQYTGNGAIFAVCVPTTKDIDRFCEIYAMFGAMCYIPASEITFKIPSALHPQQGGGGQAVVNYYQGTGITLMSTIPNSRIPKSILIDCANALSTGVRFWSERPRPLTWKDWVTYAWDIKKAEQHP